MKPVIVFFFSSAKWPEGRFRRDMQPFLRWVKKCGIKFYLKHQNLWKLLSYLTYTSMFSSKTSCEFCWFPHNEQLMYYIYLEPKRPLFWMERALFWGGWPSKIEVIWALGIYIYIWCHDFCWIQLWATLMNIDDCSRWFVSFFNMVPLLRAHIREHLLGGGYMFVEMEVLKLIGLFWGLGNSLT